MKLVKPLRLRSSAFTMIEILIVIAIIAALAALSVAYVKESNRKSRTKETEARVKLLEDALANYKNDKGEFPVPKNESATGDFFGASFKIGGAACLYQALSGDGNDEIQGYRTVKGETPGASTGELGSTKGTVYLTGMNVSMQAFAKNVENRWVIIDSFKNPIQYRPRTSKNDEQMFNDDYDLWSYGAAKNSDDSDEARKQWITNWK